MEREDDEQGPTLKDGAAYAFFPLNSVNWPYRLHFHIDQPTNLARDNWNPSDEVDVKQQMRRAVAGLTRWLEKHTGKWHPNWRIESLINRRPNQNEQWAWQFWECLRDEMRHRALLRTFIGGFATTKGAKSVALMAKPEARSAWCMVLQHVPGSADASQLVEVEKDSDLVQETLTPGELADFCVAAAKIEPRNADLEQAAFTALRGLTTVSLSADAKTNSGLVLGK